MIGFWHPDDWGFACSWFLGLLTCVKASLATDCLMCPLDAVTSCLDIVLLKSGCVSQPLSLTSPLLQTCEMGRPPAIYLVDPFCTQLVNCLQLSERLETLLIDSIVWQLDSAKLHVFMLIIQMWCLLPVYHLRLFFLDHAAPKPNLEVLMTSDVHLQKRQNHADF